MLGRTHQIVGLTAGLATYLSLAPPHYQPATFAAVLVTSHLLALLPDVDQPLTDFWRVIPTGRYLGKVAALFLDHRNLTHSLLGCALVWYGLTFLGNSAPVGWGIDMGLVRAAGMAAYVSHLVADMVTVQGIPLLFPGQRMFGIPPRPFEGVRIITGKWFENLVVFPLSNLAFLVLLALKWEQVKLLLFP
ncbi:MAG TPA: metal-dependent hydrolase [Verrucomicrobiae bacterium]|nr:metal-dependent hydrolase [Verrucomicrobiae bacterium]